MSDTISIQSRDFWFKVIEMLQQNWALIEKSDEKVVVYFLSDDGGVFDEIEYKSTTAAETDSNSTASTV